MSHVAQDHHEIGLLRHLVHLRDGVLELLVEDMVFLAVEMRVGNDRELKWGDLRALRPRHADPTQVDADSLRRERCDTGLAGQREQAPLLLVDCLRHVCPSVPSR